MTRPSRIRFSRHVTWMLLALTLGASGMAHGQTGQSSPFPEPASASGHAAPHGAGEEPVLTVRGFSDLTFAAGTQTDHLMGSDHELSSHAAFRLGEIDVFATSRLSPRLSVLAEAVVASEATNAWHVDFERIQLTYRHNPYLELSAGRFHTSIGYYNTAFHHGTWFQTTAGRPFMYAFEDTGGLLPVHNVGITATGMAPGVEALGLQWIAEIGNGRSADTSAEPVQNVQSDRGRKAVNIGGYARPRQLPGLQLGGSFYIDRRHPAGLESVGESIASAYGVYNTSPWEVLVEGVWLTHEIAHSTPMRTPMFNVQASRQVGPVRPYVRYQSIDSPADDPINVFRGHLRGPSIGCRWDASAFAAVKLEYSHVHRDRAPHRVNGIVAQLAFAF